MTRASPPLPATASHLPARAQPIPRLPPNTQSPTSAAGNHLNRDSADRTDSEDVVINIHPLKRELTHVANLLRMLPHRARTFTPIHGVRGACRTLPAQDGVILVDPTHRYHRWR